MIVGSGGRPTKCTPDVIRRFAEYMGAGLYLRHAAALCEITPRTAERWLKWGEEALAEADDDLDLVPAERRPYAEFCRVVRAREAQAISRALAIVQRAAQDRPVPRDEDGEPMLIGDWRAAEAFLRMLCPDTFGQRQQKTELSGRGGGPIEIKHDKLDDPDRVAEVINILTAVGAIPPGGRPDGDDD